MFQVIKKENASLDTFPLKNRNYLDYSIPGGSRIPTATYLPCRPVSPTGRQLFYHTTWIRSI